MASFRAVATAYQKAARDSIRDIANIVLERGNAVIEAEAVDRGDLLSSGEIVMDEERPRAVIRWTAHHAKYVHWGTRPHWPPFAPILAWVKRNMVRWENAEGQMVDFIKPSGKLIREQGRRSPNSVAIRVARAIQAKIAREGTAPVPYASKGAAEANRLAAGILKANINIRLAKARVIR